MIDIKTMTVPGSSRNPWSPMNSLFEKQVLFFDADPHWNSGHEHRGEHARPTWVSGFYALDSTMGLYTQPILKGA
jgi:hypothetical protein